MSEETKMNNDGREVKEIWFDGANECTRDGIIISSDYTTMICHNEFHGDHDIDWICVYDNDEEIERHNCKYIASIIWKNYKEK